jgi:hypothetical protein
MYLTYSKALSAFYQQMVQLEFDAPDDSKVYVDFQEGFVPLAEKYYAALAEDKVVEILVDKPTVAEEFIDVVVEGVPVVDDVGPAPILVHTPAEPVVDVVVEEVPVVDVVRPDPVSDPAPVIDPAEQVVDVPVVAKKARKTSV